MDISPAEQSFDAVTPRLNLLMRISENASVYATLSKGFRSGGINGFGSSIPDFDPEEAMLYEIGGRGTFLDGRVSVDGAIYYSDYDDVQVAIVENGRARTTNVNSASGFGADLAVGVDITETLVFNVTAGYVGREYDDVDSTNPANVADGDDSQYTPTFTTSASLAYDFNWTDDLGGMARLDVSHADGFDVYLRTFPAQPVLETDPLTYLNFRVGAVTERWQIVLSADNLLNEEDLVFPRRRVLARYLLATTHLGIENGLLLLSEKQVEWVALLLQIGGVSQGANVFSPEVDALSVLVPELDWTGCAVNWLHGDARGGSRGRGGTVIRFNA